MFIMNILIATKKSWMQFCMNLKNVHNGSGRVSWCLITRPFSAMTVSVIFWRNGLMMGVAQSG